MKRCEQCGSEFNNDQFFCSVCGGRLVELVEPERAIVNYCGKCGNVIPNGFVFCPKCGTEVNYAEAVREIPQVRAGGYAEPIYAPPTYEPAKKRGSKTGKIVAACSILALLIVGGIFLKITSPKELELNSGQPIEIYVGDDDKVTVSGEGLSGADYQDVVWSTDNEDVLSVENGDIRASYDSNSFNEIAGEGEETDMDPCSCSTTLNASIKKGLRTWEGSVPVTVSLKPVKIENGKLIKKPADACASSLKVTPSFQYNTYVYLESKTKKANDMSFVVKKGEVVTIPVPMDKYIMYQANGDTWYGGEFLFGPQTEYIKVDEEWDFTAYTWTVQFGAINGNLSNETIEEDEFPNL